MIIMLTGCYNGGYALRSPANSYHTCVTPYVQARRVYDQWASVMSVVILWCSPEVVRIHNRMYEDRFGYTYPYSHPHALICMMPYCGVPQLNTTYRNGIWAVTLHKENRIVPAYHIYQTGLNPEYQYLLATWYNRFYEVYAVTFQEEPQAPFTIALQSPYYSVDITWSHDSCTN